MHVDQEIENEARAEEKKPINAHVVYKAIKKEGEEEVSRSAAALAFSGLAAGLSMGFTLITEAAIGSHLPDVQWAPLISKLGYSVGFMIVILGRQQFFTENTVTPIIPLLDRESRVGVRDVARLWGIVLLANLIGAAAFAWATAYLEFFGRDMRQEFHALGIEAFEGSFAKLLVGGAFAGYLVALMAWLKPAAENARLAVILILAYMIGLAGFPHIIAGSVNVFYLVAVDRLSFGSYLVNYMLPVLLGNIIGGVSLVAALNYGQVAAGHREE